MDSALWCSAALGRLILHRISLLVCPLSRTMNGEYHNRRLIIYHVFLKTVEDQPSAELAEHFVYRAISLHLPAVEECVALPPFPLGGELGTRAAHIVEDVLSRLPRRR